MCTAPIIIDANLTRMRLHQVVQGASTLIHAMNKEVGSKESWSNPLAPYQMCRAEKTRATEGAKGCSRIDRHSLACRHFLEF